MLLEREGRHDSDSVSGLKVLPTLQEVPSGETFGIVKSAHSITYMGLLDVKEEETDGLGTPVSNLLDMANCDADAAAVMVTQDLQIDPKLFLIPQPKPGSAPPLQLSTTRTTAKQKRWRSAVLNEPDIVSI